MFGMLWTFWLKTGSDPEFCEKKIGQSPWSNHSHLVFQSHGVYASVFCGGALWRGDGSGFWRYGSGWTGRWRLASGECRARGTEPGGCPGWLSHQISDRMWHGFLGWEDGIQMEDLQQTIGLPRIGATSPTYQGRLLGWAPEWPSRMRSSQLRTLKEP